MSNDKTDDKLVVYLNDAMVGHLWLDERRRFVFQYDSEWLRHPGRIALSLNLPLQSEVYSDDLARPFFANLLPEAEIRRIIASRLRISEKNDFILLRRIGGECAGAVSVFPEGASAEERPGYRELDEKELHKIVTELPRRPLMAGERGMRLSLAGAQNKLPVYMEDGRIFLATGNAPSTHILKPPIRELEGTVINEAFCMILAGKMNLQVPEVAVRENLDTLFIVKRFDRERNPAGELVRLHQEDFCQALGILPDQKYETEGGPSLKQCFDLIAGESIRPAADRMSLLNWVIFNVLIGNADSHAKNLAFLLTKPGPRLAPFYDLICTAIYESLTDRLAMKVGGEDRPNWLQLRHWKRFADSIAIKQDLVLRVLSNTVENILPKAEETAKELYASHKSTGILEKILFVIRKRVRKIA